jgi:hypothetical protein
MALQLSTSAALANLLCALYSIYPYCYPWFNMSDVELPDPDFGSNNENITIPRERLHKLLQRNDELIACNNELTARNEQQQQELVNAANAMTLLVDCMQPLFAMLGMDGNGKKKEVGMTDLIMNAGGILKAAQDPKMQEGLQKAFAVLAPLRDRYATPKTATTHANQ